MKKFLVLAVILSIASCNLMRGNAPDSEYFSTGNQEEDGSHR